VAIRIAGAAYLVWLGLHALRAAWRGARVAVVRTRASGYRQGLLSNVANPKMAIFFTSLLPQFGASGLSLLAHGVAFSLLTLAWLALVVRAGDALRVPLVRRAVDAITGVVLVALGVRVAAARR
jgi:threonine/homoserine/homoserine lactone efflux protein